MEPAATGAPPPFVGREAVVLRLAPIAAMATVVPVQEPARARTLVLDTTWTPSPDDADLGRLLGVRDLAERVLASRDPFAEATRHLDAWTEAAGVVEAMVVDGTSYWYYERLGHWMWLVDRILDTAILAAVLAETRPTAIECLPGCPPGPVAAARAVAHHHGLGFTAHESSDESADAADGSEPESEADRAGRPAVTAMAARQGTTSFSTRVSRRIARMLGRRPPDERARRRAIVEDRLDRLATEGPRLLVLHAHARQRIDTLGDSRLLDPYLGPIEDRLVGTALDPIGLERTVRMMDPAWDRLEHADRLLPADTLRFVGSPNDDAVADVQATAIVEILERISEPLVIDGIDLGPALVERLVRESRRILPTKLRTYRKIRALFRRLPPAGVLLADEYHRQEWLAAAHAEGVPSAAVQHGLIYRWHNGYMHDRRPATMRLADRTYVFGAWERRLLTSRSVYREDEVVVGGSPRLSLVRQDAVDRAAIRRRLGVATGDRLLVLSATWGPFYRTYLYPIALARLFDRALPSVHLVVKLHPSERDEGPYRAVIEGVATAGGFCPPPITVVQDIDLYGLLTSADAHLGLHSTVLTEAIATGTLNLLADQTMASDLLGYVEAGVALPVRDGADLLRALEGLPESSAATSTRQAFLDDHFEPGAASERIAADLLAWLA